ncbi:hypothetical protein AB0G73_14195 [Streptomyces sp. NPDC020719]|uniref:hypothetical protein n=1 Tax=Streptomyces sp. NPDC020719 TaxID=3154896 RepID=UPI0033D3DD58
MPGDAVWLRTLTGTPVTDADGHRIPFRITAVQSGANSSAWYLLHTEHPVAQEIFGGWHRHTSFTPVHPTEQTEGRTL